MKKADRKRLHAAINSISAAEIASIIQQQFPRAKGPKIDALAKQVIAGAHRQVSPRTLPRMQRG